MYYGSICTDYKPLQTLAYESVCFFTHILHPGKMAPP